MPPAVIAGGDPALVKNVAAVEVVRVPAVGPAERDLFSVGLVIAGEGRAVGADHVVRASRVIASPPVASERICWL